MAVELKIGGVYRVSFVKEGSSEIGPWVLVKIDDPKNKRGGASFFIDPIIDVVRGNDIRLDALVSAVMKKKQIKIQRTGSMEWATVTDLTFRISKVGEGDGGFAPSEFSGTPLDDLPEF